ncbi:MAG: hypothetical protein QF860_01895, partial [Planctomycetota bacterium]|nr:hypothetical protein [Planctomycetota bacterium]
MPCAPVSLTPLLLALSAAPQDEAAAAGAVPAPEPASWLERHDVRLGLYGSFLARKDDRGIEGDPPPDDGDVTDIARLRQVDLSLSATLVEGVDTVLTASVQSNRINTEYGVDVEEAYLEVGRLPLLGELPRGLSLQLGQFRTHFGFLNPERVFDLPQLRRPRALTGFFGVDGYSQLGGSASYERELPGEVGALRATWDYLDSGNPPLTSGEAGDVGEGGATGAQAARLAWTTPEGGAHSLRAGASYYRGRQADRDERRTNLFGLDALYTWSAPEREGLNAWRLGGEWIGARIDRDGAAADEPESWYAWSQVQLGRRWILGAHYDVSEELDAPELVTRS